MTLFYSRGDAWVGTANKEEKMPLSEVTRKSVITSNKGKAIYITEYYSLIFRSCFPAWWLFLIQLQ